MKNEKPLYLNIFRLFYEIYWLINRKIDSCLSIWFHYCSKRYNYWLRFLFFYGSHFVKLCGVGIGRRNVLYRKFFGARNTKGRIKICGENDNYFFLCNNIICLYLDHHTSIPRGWCEQFMTLYTIWQNSILSRKIWVLPSKNYKE